MRKSSSGQDGSAFDGLIQRLNHNHDAELKDSDRYIFQTLYSRIYEQMKAKPVVSDFGGFSDRLEEVFSSELDKMDEKYKNRFEIIMSNDDVKQRIVEFLSKQVYMQSRGSF